MQWLHLTDLHWGHNSEQQTVAATSLLAAIAEHSPKFDLVFITGDITYSGKEREYESFENNFLTPLRKLDVVGDAQIIAVPGNHDVDCSKGTPINWDSIGSTRQTQFFNFDDRGREIRSTRIQNFSAYLEFAKRNAISTPDFSQKPADIIDIPAFPEISLVALNTCFFSDYEQSDKHSTPAPSHALSILSKDIPPHSQVVVLGHYPISWFTPRTQRPFRTALMESAALYLHGHEHEIEASFEATGLLSLGFGASYASPMHSNAIPYYRNSFAICLLEDFLHVAPYVWDCENGRWIPERQVPPSFSTESDKIKNGYQIAVSRTPASAGMQAESQQKFMAVEKSLTLGESIMLAKNESEIWETITRALNLIQGIESVSPLPRDSRGINCTQLIIAAKSGKYLVRAISAVGNILSKKSVEETNTTIDTESLDQAIILTLGSVSGDAQTLADQLERNRKPIRILDGREINQQLSTSYLSGVLRDFSARYKNPVAIRPLYCSDGISLLITDQLCSEWFFITKLDGEKEASSSEIVYLLREERPLFKDLEYRDNLDEVNSRPQDQVPKKTPVFDVESYKASCFRIHDDIQYPGLAAIGLQIPNKSVKQLYIATGADSVLSDIEQESISLAITDAVNALDLPSDQRSQLHQALTGQYGISSTAESGAAAEMYELYGNILVEGDPGSGKSLFVRNSILNYCEPGAVKVTWYSQHIPVFLPLAEVSRLRRHSSSLLEVCAEYARTTRIQISNEDLLHFLSVGRVAFFFDGLDEISTIEERSELASEISLLMDQYCPLGNRFVLTSRPAAVHSVDVPSSLARLNLRGLTDDEMRLLAEKILATSILSDGSRDLTDSQRQIVDRLVDDCNEVPGIRRLGRNPLLLTLLVLIYANSGPMVAKRHIVYAQAIRTLVSVRQRQIKREMLSEADLRRELGTIALAIYEGRIPEIPSRSQIHTMLAEDPASSFVDTSSTHSIDAFLQDISNSTGIVRFHQRSDDRKDDVLTFMHHSFLEFYAAIKLVDDNFLANLQLFAMENRWREVIVLAAGIYADRAEVTNVIRALKDIPGDVDKITGKLLNLALECASESDVPPVEAQTLLADWILEYVVSGAAKIAHSAREELAKPLRNLMETTHSTALSSALATGISHTSPQTAAASIEITGYLGGIADSFPEILHAFTNACIREDATVRSAIMRSAGRSQAFNTEATQNLIARAIVRGSAEERKAALQALEANVPLGTRFSVELRQAVFEGGTFAPSAARVAIRSAAFRNGNSIDFEFLDKALNALILGHRAPQGVKLSLILDYDELEGWLHSNDTQERIRAVRLIGLSEENFVRAYGLLIEIVLKEKMPEIVTEALTSISKNSNISQLMRLDDVASIRKQIESRFGNVRKAAIITLGKVPPLQDVVHDLIAYARKAENDGQYSEYDTCIESIAQHASSDTHSANFLTNELSTELKSTDRGWGRTRVNKLKQLTAAVDVATPDVDAGTVAIIYSSISDHTVPEELQTAFMLVFGKIAQPNADNAALVEALVNRKLKTHRQWVSRSLLSFVRRCRGRLEYVRATYPFLQRIQLVLIRNWEQETRREIGMDEESSLNILRNCILEVDRLLKSYRDIGY